MVSCGETFKLLVDFSLETDTEKIKERWGDLQKHMEACESCKSFLSSLLKIKLDPAGEHGQHVRDNLLESLSNLSRYYIEKSASLPLSPASKRGDIKLISDFICCCYCYGLKAQLAVSMRLSED